MCLVFDEVKIREELVYDKNLFRIVGFVDIGDHNNHMLELERAQRGEQHKPKYAGLYGAWPILSPQVSLCTISLHSSDTIFPLVWACIKRLEMCGFKVLACTADVF